MVKRTLESLFAQAASPASYEVIVVVDGSTDGTMEALRALKPAIRLRFIEQENRGPAGARNAGYRAAESDLVLFLDDDMLCEPGLVDAHITAHKGSAPTVAFGALFLSADSPPSLAAECFKREIGALHMKNKVADEASWQLTDCVFSNTSLPRRILEEFGGFDETFRMREDLELGFRLFSAGILPQYIKEAIAYQSYDKTGADLIRDAEAFAVGDVKFARKHPAAMLGGQLNWLAEQPSWKRTLRRMAAVWPPAADMVLAPACSLGETFFHIPAFREMGVRGLQVRRRIHWQHMFTKCDRHLPESGREKAD